MREHAHGLLSAVYTGKQLFNLQLLVPPLVDPRTEVWTVHDGVGWVLQNTGALLWTLPGGQWTPGDPPSSLHRARLQLLGVVLPVTTQPVVVEGSKIEPRQTP